MRLTSRMIRDTLGDIDDAMTTAILATGATPEEFEEAVGWMTGESEVMSETGHELEGAAAAICEILSVDDDDEGERSRE